MEKVKRAVLEFRIGDVEDPDMYANIEVDAWATKNRDAYKFLLEYADANVALSRRLDDSELYHLYTISAYMSEEHWAEYYLKYGESYVSRYQYS
jgi:hypothetical protein